MVAKPPEGRPGMAGDEPVLGLVAGPAFLPQPAALPALSWLSTAALVPPPPESLRPAEPGPSLIALPGRATPAPGLTAAPACLAASPCRAAAPPAHARLVCFVCCMMSLLFCSYVLLLRANPLPAISRIGSQVPLSHTFHEHSRVARPPDSDCQATRHVLLVSRFCGATPGNKMDTHAT